MADASFPCPVCTYGCPITANRCPMCLTELDNPKAVQTAPGKCHGPNTDFCVICGYDKMNDDGNPLKCVECTFINDEGALDCSICGVPLPAAKDVPAASDDGYDPDGHLPSETKRSAIYQPPTQDTIDQTLKVLTQLHSTQKQIVLMEEVPPNINNNDNNSDYPDYDDNGEPFKKKQKQKKSKKKKKKKSKGGCNTGTGAEPQIDQDEEEEDPDLETGGKQDGRHADADHNNNNCDNDNGDNINAHENKIENESIAACNIDKNDDDDNKINDDNNNDDDNSDDTDNDDNNDDTDNGDNKDVDNGGKDGNKNVSDNQDNDGKKSLDDNQSHDNKNESSSSSSTSTSTSASPALRAVFTAKSFERTPDFTKQIDPTFEQLSYGEAKMLLDSFEFLADMMDRSQQMRVVDMILSTSLQGLPLFKTMRKINNDIIYCMQYILFKVQILDDPAERVRIMKKLGQGYQACQTIQQQTITSLFAELANVELNFQNQIKKFLAVFKTEILDQTVILSQPTVNQDDAGPHIRSSYLCAIVDKTGISIPGYEASALDKHAPQLDEKTEERVITTFLRLYDAEAWIEQVAADVTAKEGLSRVIDRDKFYQWVMGLDDDVGFEKHTIFYDEDRADEFLVAQKEEDWGMVPYISTKVARRILQILGYVS